MKSIIEQILNKCNINEFVVHFPKSYEIVYYFNENKELCVKDRFLGEYQNFYSWLKANNLSMEDFHTLEKDFTIREFGKYRMKYNLHLISSGYVKQPF